MQALIFTLELFQCEDLLQWLGAPQIVALWANAKNVAVFDTADFQVATGLAGCGQAGILRANVGLANLIPPEVPGDRDAIC
jgi:hypothetical protein